MLFRVSGLIGDMPVELVVEAADSKRDVGKRSEVDVSSAIADAKAVLGEELARLGEALVEALGEQTKRGFASESRALREVWEPLVHAVGMPRYSVEGLVSGMRVALERGKLSVAYAKGVARGEAARGVPAAGPVVVSKYRTVQ